MVSKKTLIRPSDQKHRPIFFEACEIVQNNGRLTFRSVIKIGNHIETINVLKRKELDPILSLFERRSEVFFEEEGIGKKGEGCLVSLAYWDSHPY